MRGVHGYVVYIWCVCEYVWVCMRYVWVCMDMYVHVVFVLIIPECVCVCTRIQGCMGYAGHVCVCMGMHVYVCVCKCMLGHVWDIGVCMSM